MYLFVFKITPAQFFPHIFVPGSCFQAPSSSQVCRPQLLLLNKLIQTCLPCFPYLINLLTHMYISVYTYIYMNYMCVCVNFNSITLPSNKCNLHQYYQFYLHQVCLGQTFLYQTYFYQTCLYHVLPRYQIYLCQTYLHQTALFQIYPCQTYRLSKLPLYQTYLISPSNLPLSICLCQTYLKLISLPNLLSLYYITYR